MLRSTAAIRSATAWGRLPALASSSVASQVRCISVRRVSWASSSSERRVSVRSQSDSRPWSACRSASASSRRPRWSRPASATRLARSASSISRLKAVEVRRRCRPRPPARPRLPPSRAGIPRQPRRSPRCSESGSGSVWARPPRRPLRPGRRVGSRSAPGTLALGRRSRRRLRIRRHRRMREGECEEEGPEKEGRRRLQRTRYAQCTQPRRQPFTPQARQPTRTHRKAPPRRIALSGSSGRGADGGRRARRTRRVRTEGARAQFTTVPVPASRPRCPPATAAIRAAATVRRAPGQALRRGPPPSRRRSPHLPPWSRPVPSCGSGGRTHPARPWRHRRPRSRSACRAPWSRHRRQTRRERTSGPSHRPRSRRSADSAIVPLSHSVFGTRPICTKTPSSSTWRTSPVARSR